MRRNHCKTAFAALLALCLTLSACAEKSAGASPAMTPETSAVPSGQVENTFSASPAASAEAAGDSTAYYISLLGLSKEEITAKIGEEPSDVDEGGLEFKNAGIRVWFDGNENRTVSQVFTARKDISLNGAVIGDKIDAFKKAFGTPLSDKNGDMHFAYKGAYLSVIYDTASGDTAAVYILKNDF